MKLCPIRYLLSKPFIVAGIHAALAILMISLINISTPQGPLETQRASANSHLGILGRQAPELNLNNWIDQAGKQRASIQLSDFRGKVIYLYFFQDW